MTSLITSSCLNRYQNFEPPSLHNAENMIGYLVVILNFWLKRSPEPSQWQPFENFKIFQIGLFLPQISKDHYRLSPTKHFANDDDDNDVTMRFWIFPSIYVNEGGAKRAISKDNTLTKKENIMIWYTYLVIIWRLTYEIFQHRHVFIIKWINSGNSAMSNLIFVHFYHY